MKAVGGCGAKAAAPQPGQARPGQGTPRCTPHRFILPSCHPDLAALAGTRCVALPRPRRRPPSWRPPARACLGRRRKRRAAPGGQRSCLQPSLPSIKRLQRWRRRGRPRGTCWQPATGELGAALRVLHSDWPRGCGLRVLAGAKCALAGRCPPEAYRWQPQRPLSRFGHLHCFSLTAAVPAAAGCGTAHSSPPILLPHCSVARLSCLSCLSAGCRTASSS